MNTHPNSIMLLCNRNIDQATLARAVTCAEELVKWARKYLAGYLMPVAVGQQFNAVNRFFAEMNEAEVELMASLNVAQLARELCNLWEQGNPDLIIDGFKSSTNRILLSVHSTESQAYQIIQQAKLLGLLDAVGAI